MEKTVEMIHSEIIHDQTKFLFLYGARGGGKSTSGHLKAVINALEMPRLRVLIARKTRNSLKQTSYLTVKEILYNLGIAYNEIKAESKIVLPNGSFMVFDGIYTSEGKNERLKSTNWGLIVIDEATELQFTDLKELLPSLRDKVGYRQMVLIFNPPRSSKHWIYKFFEEESKRGRAKRVFFPYQGNPYLPEDFKDELEAIQDYDIGLWKRYAKGEWKVDTLTGLIYNNWSVRTISDDEISGMELFAGVDFGYNNPSVFLLMGRYPGDDKTIFLLREIYVREKTTKQFIGMIVELLGEEVNQLDVPMYADPSAPDKILEMQLAGLNANRANNSVLAGIDFIKQRKLVINDSLVNTIREIGNYQWQTDKKTGEKIDAPVKFDDHSMDAMRYGIYTHLKGGGNMEAFLV